MLRYNSRAYQSHKRSTVGRDDLGPPTNRHAVRIPQTLACHSEGVAVGIFILIPCLSFSPKPRRACTSVTPANRHAVRISQTTSQFPSCINSTPGRANPIPLHRNDGNNLLRCHSTNEQVTEQPAEESSLQ